jgi:hypothetical protein
MSTVDTSSQLKAKTLLASIVDSALTSDTEPVGIDFLGRKIHVTNPSDAPTYLDNPDWKARYTQHAYQKWVHERTTAGVRKTEYGFYVVGIPRRNDLVIRIEHGNEVFLTHVKDKSAWKSLIEFAKNQGIFICLPQLGLVNAI